MRLSYRLVTAMVRGLVTTNAEIMAALNPDLYRSLKAAENDIGRSGMLDALQRHDAGFKVDLGSLRCIVSPAGFQLIQCG